MTELERAAALWVREVHPYATHLERTRQWVLSLDPAASEALRIAALLHDIERAFPDPGSSWDSARDWTNPEYVRWHERRSSRVADQWLHEHGAPEQLRSEVQRLISAHEQGGWPEADLLQAADSLSFLETLVPLTVSWVERGVPLAEAIGKLKDMSARIQFEAARAPAARLLDKAVAEVHRAAAP